MSNRKYNKRLAAYELKLEPIIDTIKIEREIERKKLASERNSKALKDSERYMLSQGYDKKDIAELLNEHNTMLMTTASKSFTQKNYEENILTIGNRESSMDDLIRILAIERLQENGIEQPVPEYPFSMRYPMVSLVITMGGFLILLVIFSRFILPSLFEYFL